MGSPRKKLCGIKTTPPIMGRYAYFRACLKKIWGPPFTDFFWAPPPQRFASPWKNSCGRPWLGVLKRNLRHCPRSIKDMAYKTILWPKLEYASAVWDPITEDNISKLEAVQRRAARFVCNSYRQTASVSSILSELSWPLLEQRRAEARLGLFYRIVHKSVDIDAAKLMTRSTRPTRKANNRVHTTSSLQKVITFYGYFN